MIDRRCLTWVVLCLLTVAAEAAEGGRVRIGDRVVVTVEVARTEAEKIRGLSGRENLAPGAGMLFVYEPPARPVIWMRGMRFPLDILWIRNGRIVGLVHGAKPPAPGEAPPVYAPREEVQYVLEVPAGFAEHHEIVLNDSVEIQLKRGRSQ